MRSFAWLLLIEGVIEGIRAFRQRAESRFSLPLLTAVLSVIVGFMLLRNTEAGALVLTLVLSIYFMAGGLFRIVAATATGPPRWGWVLANGIVALLLGVLVFAHWPSSALWILGLFIGIDMLVGCWSRVMLALADRKSPPAPPSGG